MSIEQSNCVRRFIRVCNDGWEKGWHEANGGNLSYRMDAEDVTVCMPYLNAGGRPWMGLNVSVPGLGGAFFIVTGAGKHMRKVSIDMADNIGIVELNGAGDAYRVVWGLAGTSRPSSEFEAHLLAHEARARVSGGFDRVIYHAHTPQLVTLTTAFHIDSRVLSRVLWKSTTECILGCPEGVGLLEFMVPGTPDIAQATAALMDEFRTVVWTSHGVITAGENFDDTFGMIDNLEKAAGIYNMGRAMCGGQEPTNLLSDDQLREICAAYGLEPNAKFLVQR